MTNDEAVVKLRKLSKLTSSEDACQLAIQALQEQESLPAWCAGMLLVGLFLGYTVCAIMLGVR